MRLPIGTGKYLSAIVTVSIAVGLRYLIDPWLLDRQPYATLYGAVALCVWYCGYRPALLAALLGYLACDYFFTHPRKMIYLAGPDQGIALIAYTISCALIIVFAEGMRRARRRADRNAFQVAALNEQLRAILENAPVAIWTTFDPQCGRVDCNSFAHAIFTPRAGPNDPGRSTSLAVLPVPTPAPITSLLQQSMQKNELVRSMELDLEGAAGHIVHALASAVPLRNPDGTVLGAVATCVDIAERKRAEEALKLADRRKDEFLATVTHELRNPLAPIRTAVALLRRMPMPSDEIRELRDVIDRQVGQMARLLDDLLDVSRMAVGKISLRKEAVALQSAVEGAVETCRPLIQSRGHRLTVTQPPRAIYIDADAARLVQVFSNLLNNAAKYMSPGGRIDVNVRMDRETAVVSVKDTGMGIRPDRLSDVFGLFVQGDDRPNGEGEGMGIGLSVVKKLVELHDGTIEARSEGIGRGSEFIVRIPTIQAPVSATPGVASLGAGGKAPGLHILIADDNVDSARLIGRILEQSGQVIRTAKDGFEAVEIAQAFRPDVAVLDLEMPGLNGCEVARRLRSDLGEQVLLLALTGRSQDKDRKLALEAGFDHFLIKPIDPETIEKLVADYAPREKQPVHAH